MEKYKNKYRISSARLYGYDYGKNGAYFITICTKNRTHHFGEILNGEMKLSEIGKCASDCWSAIPEHFPFVELGEFVIMPNHVHGVIIINKEIEPNLNNEFEKPIVTEFYRNKFGPQSKNVASIIRGFKVGVTISSRIINSDFYWQPRFHDHIIRDSRAFINIRNYIIQNPKKWKDDRFYIS